MHGSNRPSSSEMDFLNKEYRHCRSESPGMYVDVGGIRTEYAFSGLRHLGRIAQNGSENSVHGFM